MHSPITSPGPYLRNAFRFGRDKRREQGCGAVALVVMGHGSGAPLLHRQAGRFASMGGVAAAGLMGLIGYFVSYRAIFLAAAALVLPLLAALGRIQNSDIHFGFASGVPAHQEPGAPPRAGHRILWENRSLLIFAACIFLFQIANASMLPLAGEALAYGKGAYSSLIVSALIMVPQVIVVLMAAWVGGRANIWGRCRFCWPDSWPCRSVRLCSLRRPIP